MRQLILSLAIGALFCSTAFADDRKLDSTLVLRRRDNGLAPTTPIGSGALEEGYETGMPPHGSGLLRAYFRRPRSQPRGRIN